MKTTTKTLPLAAMLAAMLAAIAMPTTALADDPKAGDACTDSDDNAGVQMYTDSDKDGWGAGDLECVTGDDRSAYSLRVGDPDDEDATVRGEVAHRAEYHSLTPFGRQATELYATMLSEGATPEHCATLTKLTTPDDEDPWSARANFASVVDNKVGIMIGMCASANHVTKDELAAMGYVTRDEVQAMVTEATRGMATQSWVLSRGYATQSWVTSGFISKEDGVPTAYFVGAVGGFGLPTSADSIMGGNVDLGVGTSLLGSRTEILLRVGYDNEGPVMGGALRHQFLTGDKARLLAGFGLRVNPMDEQNGDGYVTVTLPEFRAEFGSPKAGLALQAGSAGIWHKPNGNKVLTDLTVDSSVQLYFRPGAE